MTVHREHKVKRGNQQDATNPMCFIKLLSQHVSGIIMPIISNKQLHKTTANHNQCKTPHAAVHGLVLLMMGIMMPETCWDRSLIKHIGLVASCWFSLFTFLHIFSKYILISSFVEICRFGSVLLKWLQTGGRIDMTKVTVAFRNFANATSKFYITRQVSNTL